MLDHYFSCVHSSLLFTYIYLNLFEINHFSKIFVHIWLIRFFVCFFLKNIFSFLRYLDPITDKTCRYLNLKKTRVCFYFHFKKMCEANASEFFSSFQVNHLKYKFRFNCVSVCDVNIDRASLIDATKLDV